MLLKMFRHLKHIPAVPVLKCLKRLKHQRNRFIFFHFNSLIFSHKTGSRNYLFLFACYFLKKISSTFYKITIWRSRLDNFYFPFNTSVVILQSLLLLRRISSFLLTICPISTILLLIDSICVSLYYRRFHLIYIKYSFVGLLSTLFFVLIFLFYFASIWSWW